MIVNQLLSNLHGASTEIGGTTDNNSHNCISPICYELQNKKSRICTRKCFSRKKSKCWNPMLAMLLENACVMKLLSQAWVVGDGSAAAPFLEASPVQREKKKRGNSCVSSLNVSSWELPSIFTSPNMFAFLLEGRDKIRRTLLSIGLLGRKLDQHMLPIIDKFWKK